MKIALGFLIAFAIGALCRITGVPLPAPAVLIGSLLVVATTVGYIAMDRYAAIRVAKHGANGPSSELPRDGERPS